MILHQVNMSISFNVYHGERWFPRGHLWILVSILPLFWYFLSYNHSHFQGLVNLNSSRNFLILERFPVANEPSGTRIRIGWWSIENTRKKLVKILPALCLKNLVICSDPEYDKRNLEISSIQNFFIYFIGNKFVFKEHSWLSQAHQTLPDLSVRAMGFNGTVED